jgi:hypothetical protein
VSSGQPSFNQSTHASQSSVPKQPTSWSQSGYVSSHIRCAVRAANVSQPVSPSQVNRYSQPVNQSTHASQTIPKQPVTHGQRPCLSTGPCQSVNSSLSGTSCRPPSSQPVHASHSTIPKQSVPLRQSAPAGQLAPPSQPAPPASQSRHPPASPGNTASGHTFLQFNCNGVKNSLAELNNFLQVHKIKVACLQETRLSDKAKDPKFPGYTLLRKDRPVGNGGGVAILVHHSINFIPLDTSTLLPGDAIVELQGISTTINALRSTFLTSMSPLLRPVLDFTSLT